MPQINPMESLQTMLRLRTPAQVQTGDPWMARRQSEIGSGLDEWLPDADSPEYKYDQMEKGQHYGVSLPRADARSADMSRLRQVLGMQGVKHQQNLEQQTVKGEYDIAGQVAGQQAAMDRLLAAQGAITGRSERGYDERAALEEERQAAMAERAAAAAGDRSELERYRQGEMNKRSNATQGGGLFDLLKRILGIGGSDEAAEEAPVEQSTAAPRRRPTLVGVR
jgi:hypothetical protein